MSVRCTGRCQSTSLTIGLYPVKGTSIDLLDSAASTIWPGVLCQQLTSSQPRKRRVYKVWWKRPDGLRLIPWKMARAWRRISLSSAHWRSPVFQRRQYRLAGSSGGCKRQHRVGYAQLAHTYTFMHMATGKLRPINSVGLEFLSDLGRRISQVSNDHCESVFSLQSLSVLIRRFSVNAIQCTSPTHRNVLMMWVPLVPALSSHF